MPTLPATGYIENASRTVAEIKAALEALRDMASVLPGGAARPELTIASGVVTPAARDHGGHIRIDTESDASSDDLDIVAQTNTYAGQRLRLYAENASRVVTVKHGNGGAGELLMVDAADFVLDSLDKWIEFERRSSSWVEVDRSYGAAALVTPPTEAAAFLRGDLTWARQTCEKIAGGTVTNEATLDLTGLSNAYAYYELVFDDLVPVSDNVGLWLRTDSDGGASFDAGASDYAYAWLTVTEAGAVAGSGGSGDTKIQVLSNAGNGAAEQASGRITIYNPGKGGQRPKVSWEISYRDQANVFRRSSGSGERTSAAAAIDAIRILFSSGNIDTMNYTLYGYRA